MVSSKCFFELYFTQKYISILDTSIIVVRFLALVTMMVTKVDHGNHSSNDRRNHRSNHHGYYDDYYYDNT